MSAITFRVVVNEEQVIRPPDGVLLPPGGLDVTVTPVAEEAVAKPTERAAANLRLRQHRVSLGHATRIENEGIDAELARAYGTGSR